MLRNAGWAAALLLAGAHACPAQEARVLPDQAVIDLVLNGQPVTLSRPADPDAVLSGPYARTARPCPSECLQPMEAVTGVRTVAELEVIDFLSLHVANGSGILIDARLPDGFATGRLPGAVNVPFATLAPENPLVGEILKALGVQVTAGGTMDFATALLVYGDGSFSDQAARAVQYLVLAGYPAERIKYYRGGMQEWLHSGLTVIGVATQG